MHFYLGQKMLQNSPKEILFLFKLLTKEVAENLYRDFKIIYL